jgi:hypothetical protein
MVIVYPATPPPENHPQALTLSGGAAAPRRFGCELVPPFDALASTQRWGAEHRASISPLEGDRAMAHDGTNSSNRPSPRRRSWRWLAAAAAGLFTLGLAVPAGAASHSSGSSHSGGSSTVNWSWMVQILPFIEQDNVFHSAPTAPVANFVMGDGSVRSVSNSIDIATWQALGTRAGGELVSDG